MRRSKKLRLSEKSFRDAADWALTQKKDFNAKLEEFMETLADYGIAHAIIVNNDPEFSEYIVFGREWRAGEMIFFAKKTEDLRRYWIGGPPEGVDVDPLLMVEFGSGQYARSDAWTVLTGTGRGTFQPNSGHANEDYWHFQPIYLDGTVGHWQTSSGVKPTKPVLTAFNAMYKDWRVVRKVVFGA